MDDLHYIFKDDKVYAIREGKVVASADSLGELEKLAWGEDGPDYGYGEDRALADSMQGHGQDFAQDACPHCGSYGNDGTPRCPDCGQDVMQPGAHGYQDQVGGPTDYPMDGDDGANDNWRLPMASVVGPGGLKGKVLGKVRDIWGEEVAVRFENGRIAHLRVAQDGSLQGGFKQSIEKTASAPATPGADLTARLEAGFEHTRAGVTARLDEVESIRMDARARMASASPADQSLLDSIMLTAEVERGTLRQALDAIESDEAAQAEFAPYDMQAAPAGESLGRGDGNWLDGVVSAMIAEAEGQDFEKIAKEEPALFVSDLNPGALADTGATRDMATRYIRSKTAGLAREAATGIERTFLANVEAARKQALSEVKQSTHKEAAAREDRYADLPDDILFS